jgi:hypothetical protein
VARPAFVVLRGQSGATLGWKKSGPGLKSSLRRPAEPGGKSPVYGIIREALSEAS